MVGADGIARRVPVETIATKGIRGDELATSSPSGTRRRLEMQTWKVTGGKSIRAWTDGVPLGEEAQAQLERASQLPFIQRHLAVMPDVHWGMGSTVGSVIPTKGAIIPAAIDMQYGHRQGAITLLHEVFHCAFRFVDLQKSDDEERIVTALNHAVAALWRDNPVVFGWIAEGLRDG